MAILSKIKYHFEQLLSEIYSESLNENNQKVCIDCLKPRSNKNTLSVKIVVVLNFVLDYHNSSFEILSSLLCIKWQYCQKLNLTLVQ